MKKKILGLALLGAVSMSHAASAQEFDNRWYVQGTVGLLVTDDTREVGNSELLGIGVGKRLSASNGLELSYDYASPVINVGWATNGDDTWTLSSIWLTGRHYFVKEGRGWDPYLAVGIGATNHKDDWFSPSRDGTEFAALVGAGIETDRRKRVDFRLEGGVRYDGDSYDYTTDQGSALVTASNGSFLDYYASLSILVKLGDLPVPVVAAPVATCDTMDSDNDGVNDCNDKCPGSEAGQTIGADGCPVKLTIDLKGVNFDFDKDTLRDDSVVILNEAVAVLAKYPELRVAVDGHTDQCGSADYNQGLSQKRAAAVYDFMVAAGIDAGRLSGPTGYGESMPLVNTGDAYPACKNETNRRTELNVQN
jgi:OOP family OmpA-OmpF porin